MAARIAVAVVAALITAWLGVMERDARLLARGVALGSQLSTPGTFERADEDLRGAGLLNPDTAPEYSRAILNYGAGRPRVAKGLIEDVLRREPDNREAWAALYELSRGRDPDAVRRALAARQRLDPLNARSR